MRQKAINQITKKNFILYKGHTGWKIKTRLFGTLLVSLSAITIAESAGTLDAHADTGTGASSAEVSPAPTPKTTGSAQLRTTQNDTSASGATTEQTPATTTKGTPAPTTESNGTTPTEPTSSGTSATSAAKATVTETPAMSQINTLKSAPAPKTPVVEAAEVADTTTDNAAMTTSSAANQYQVLDPGKQVDVSKVDSADGTVKLTASQIKDHFTGTLVNNGSDSNSNNDKNNVTIPIGDDGSVSLTSTDPHTFYNSYGDLKEAAVIGHQASHVAFEHAIDFGHDFSMTGALGIGNSATGADGIGIIFVPGNPDAATKGGPGMAMGLGGLKNAFGFVYDQYYNEKDIDNAADPSKSPYFGWRTTDKYGGLQAAGTSAWVNASSLNLNDRTTNPFNEFTMTYVAATKLLTISLGGHDFTQTITDTTSGYSISIAASTGLQINNYAAKIESFNYTPKTAQVNVNFTSQTTTPLETTSATTPTQVTANVGDTVLVFSSAAAAQRALEKDPTLNPNLMTVIPTDADGNVYVVDGSQASTKYIGDDQTASDGAYYSYKVTGDATQNVAVPVSLTFKAIVTPVDKATGKAIPGIAPIEVNAVAGKTTVVQIPGFTSTTITLDAPTDGQPATYNLPIDMSTTGTTTSTTDGVANPIAHYYTATGTTVDGKEVAVTATVGTNQSITDTLNGQALKDNGNDVASGDKTAITSDDYYWSTVPNAVSTDSTDETKPQDSTSMLLPTQSTLDYWIQKATDNQTKADADLKQAQAIYESFVAKPGITQAQKDAAKGLLDSVNALYTKLSDTNATANTSFTNAKSATDPATIFKDSQDGYAAMTDMDNSLGAFETDLTNLTDASENSLASFVSWSQVYGTSLAFPDVTFGSSFGTVTDEEKQGFNNSDYYYYVNALESDVHVTPKDVGVYYFKLSDAGRAYLKTLNANAQFYVSAALTITPAAVTPTISDTSIVYGGVDGTLAGITGSMGSDIANKDHAITQDEFEVVDKDGSLVPVNQLQAGSDYTIRYTADAQAALKTDGNYTFGDFGTAKLTVTPKLITVTAKDASKVYGDADPELVLTDNSDAGLVNGDKLADLDVTLTRDTSKESVSTYTAAITGSASGSNQNYTVTVAPGTFTINKKSVTVKAQDVNTTYDGTAPKTAGFSVPDNVLVSGDTAADLGVTLKPISEVNAGTYTNVITGMATSANYDVTVAPGTLTIDQAASSVDLGAATMIYGDGFPAFSATNNVLNTTSTITADDFEVVDTTTGQAVVATDVQANGKYTLKLKQTAQDRLNTENPNNKITFGTNVLTVTARPITVKINDVNTTYDGAAHGTNGFSVVTGQLATGDSDDDLGITLDPISETDAGSYTFTGKLAAKNYDVTLENGTLKIAPAAGNVEITKTGVTYGEPLPSLLVSVNGATASELSADNFEIIANDTTDEITADKLQVGGKYTVQLTSAAQTILSKANSNYNLAFGTAVLTVTARPITVKINDVNTTYDGTAHGTNGFSIVSDNALVNGDNNDALGITLDPISETNAGTYTFTGNAVAKNYDVTLESGTLKIDQAAATMTLGDATMVYGDKLPSLIATNKQTGTTSVIDASEFVIIDDTTKQAVTVDQLQANGKYTVQLTGDTQASLTKANPNYTLTFDTAKLAVTKRPVSVTVKDTGKIYGEKEPDLASTVDTSTETSTGLVNGDDLGVKLIREEGKDVKTYTIGLDNASVLNPNYTITVNPGTFTISKKPITVQIDNGDSVYGQPESELTFSIPTTVKGQANGTLVDPDTKASLGVTLTRETGTDAKDYIISGTAADNTNYDVTIENTGIFTIKPAAGSVTVVPVNMTYGETLPTLSATASVPGNTMTQSDFDIIDNATGKPVDSADLQAGGDYTVQLNQAAKTRLTEANRNYDFTNGFGTGTLSVAKRPVTIQIANQEAYAGTPNPQNDAKLASDSGAFKNGETVADLKLSYNEPTNPDVGSYAIDAINGNSNYDVTVRSGQLTVLGKNVDATGNTTITEKDADGNVVKIDKQWTDGSQTTYTYDPSTGDRTVTEQHNGKVVDQQKLTPDVGKVSLTDDENTVTVVALDPSTNQPTFEHDTTQTTTDAFGNGTATTKDTDGNVVKVTKQWTDGGSTTYTYDPMTGKQAVTEQKDGQTVDQKAITTNTPKATLSSGTGVETIVNAEKPGADPTFEHNTTQTTTDKSGNVTATTTDADGNVIKVTKQWTDGGSTTYTYDPTTGKQAVTEQKDGQTVDQKAITTNTPKATLSSGTGVETIVNAEKPGADPTFEHNTTQTTTDKSGNVTATTTDANGNVIKVTKQWTDGGSTTYTYDPTTGKQAVMEQKDGQTVDQQPITPEKTQATLSAGKGVETIVSAEKPGAEPTFEHDTTQTTTDKSGNVTATTKDANGNVIKVTKQWTDGGSTTYTYDPMTGKQSVTEQKDGQIVDQNTITADATKVTLSSGAGVETIVSAENPGSEPTFEHDTTQTTTDKSGNVTATTTDADGNVIKVTKQWTDGDRATYTYDPTTSQRTVTVERNGKTVDQRTIDPNDMEVMLVDGAGGKIIVQFDEFGAQPSFTRQLVGETGSRQVTAQNKDEINKGKDAHGQSTAVIANETADDVIVAGRVQSQQTAKPKQNQQQTTLPQTGQKNESVLARLGVVLLALLAMPFIRRRSH